jgi:hypothetical protein
MGWGYSPYWGYNPYWGWGGYYGNPYWGYGGYWGGGYYAPMYRRSGSNGRGFNTYNGGFASKYGVNSGDSEEATAAWADSEIQVQIMEDSEILVTGGFRQGNTNGGFRNQTRAEQDLREALEIQIRASLDQATITHNNLSQDIMTEVSEITEALIILAVAASDQEAVALAEEQRRRIQIRRWRRRRFPRWQIILKLITIQKIMLKKSLVIMSISAAFLRRLRMFL